MGNEDTSPSVTIRICYDDEHLIQLETRVRVGEFSGTATAYTSSQRLIEQAESLNNWVTRPAGECRIEAGADTPIGWLVLRFYPIDLAGHIVCHITLATMEAATRPEEITRLSIEMATEPALIERFARHLAALGKSPTGEAVLKDV